MKKIKSFIDICRKCFFLEDKLAYQNFIFELFNWLYEKDEIKNRFPIYYRKDKVLRIKKNPTYLTDGRMSVEKRKMSFIFNQDLMKKYYDENKYIAFIELVFHEWGHFLQYLYLTNTEENKKMPKYLLSQGKNKVKELNIDNLLDKDNLPENLEKVKNFAKWLELSNKKNVMDKLEDLYSDIEKYLIKHKDENEKDKLILEILYKNLLVERKIYDLLALTIEGEHVLPNVNSTNELVKELHKFRKWYGGRFVVVEGVILGKQTR